MVSAWDAPIVNVAEAGPGSFSAFRLTPQPGTPVWRDAPERSQGSRQPRCQESKLSALAELHDRCF
jgi:hypothetical protein